MFIFEYGLFYFAPEITWRTSNNTVINKLSLHSLHQAEYISAPSQFDSFHVSQNLILILESICGIDSNITQQI